MKEFIKKAWNYFRPSIEGKDGKISYQRLSTFVFVVMMVRLALFRIQDEWEFKTFVVFSLLYMLQTSIIRASDLIFLLKYKLKIHEKFSFDSDPMPEFDADDSSAGTDAS